MTTPRIRVTLEVHVPDAAESSTGWLSLDEILARIRDVPDVSGVEAADDFDVTQCIEVYVEITGRKKERHAAYRRIMSLFDRDNNQLRSQSYDLLAMNAD